MSLKCKTCGIHIRWQPTIVGSSTFCCIGCAYGGPCTCDYEHLPQSGDQAEIVIWQELKLEIRTNLFVQED